MNLVGDLLNKYKCYVVIDFICTRNILFCICIYTCVCIIGMYVYNAVYVWL